MRHLIPARSGEGPLAKIKYEVALRAIGQDLTALLLESLQITVENNAFVARGSCIGHAHETKSKSRQVFHKVWQDLVSMMGRGGQPRDRSSRERFVRRYTVEEIQVLDKLGSARQTGVLKTPDALSLAESLRTGGRVVDAKKGRLVNVARDPRRIAFAYIDENGRLQREELYSLSVYKTQQEALSLRIKREDM